MNKILFCGIFILCNLLAGFHAFAQPGIYIGPGANIYVHAGTIFSTDGLALTPATGFNMQGINAIDKATALAHPAAQPFIKRVFLFSNTTAPFTGSIAIYYADAELNGIAEANLTLNIHNGTSWNNFSTNVTRDAVNNTVSTSNLSNLPLNELTLASLLAPLPVKLLSVMAVCKRDGVLISWQTAAEMNSKLFEVQQSSDGRSWRSMGSVAAAGMSVGTRSYEYFDNAPGSNSWYRIVESDIDNQVSISRVVYASCLLPAGVSLCPNPVLQTAYINILSPNISAVTLNLYDARGALVKSVQGTLFRGANLVTLDMQGIARGWYTLSLIWNGDTRQLKLLKQ